jgi:hypothetical protein
MHKAECLYQGVSAVANKGSALYNYDCTGRAVARSFFHFIDDDQTSAELISDLLRAFEIIVTALRSLLKKVSLLWGLNWVLTTFYAKSSHYKLS